MRISPVPNLALSIYELALMRTQLKKNKAGQIQVTSHKKNVLLISIESVAKHGYRLIFDDDHSAIYSEDFLQTLALEHEIRWENYLSDLKDSGHSREAMIDFKQL